MDVLLVEDDHLDAEMVELTLSRDTRNRYRLTHVQTLHEALDRLETERFDIVLVDLSLPDATGDEAVNRITQTYSTMPVLVLSGNSDPEFATRVIRAGAQDFIVKGADSAASLARAMAYAVERKATESNLKRLASYDPLTNLANRQEFCTQLKKACARADRHGTMVALMVFDLDHFKMINDVHGHHAGDDLLCHVAKKLQTGIRVGDTAARLGGDEFAVILEDIPHERSVLRWSQQVLSSLSQPITIGETSHPISASLGGALYPNNGRTVDELMRSADMAMYDVKRSGRGNVALYDDNMDARRQRHVDLEAQLRNAVSHNELVPYFQPKISLDDGSLVGMEALCRWHRTNGEIVEPNEFLPIARRLGLMTEVGMFMQRAVAEQILEWHASNGPRVPISINADAQEISTPAFATRFINYLEKVKLPASSMSIEITETTLVEPSETCLDNLDMLRRSGIRVELDDFGAGHATFNYLRQFPLDALKLDRSLVIGLDTDKQCITIVKAMIALGRELGLDVIAEGIESAAQLHTLRRIGCKIGQGFFISRPMAGRQIEQWQRVVQKTLSLKPLSDQAEAMDDAIELNDRLLPQSSVIAEPTPRPAQVTRATVTPITSVIQPHANSGQ